VCGNNDISTGCGTAPSALSLGTDGKTPEVSDFYFLNHILQNACSLSIEDSVYKHDESVSALLACGLECSLNGPAVSRFLLAERTGEAGSESSSDHDEIGGSPAARRLVTTLILSRACSGDKYRCG
jgi:hypothetical protein